MPYRWEEDDVEMMEASDAGDMAIENLGVPDKHKEGASSQGGGKS